MVVVSAQVSSPCALLLALPSLCPFPLQCGSRADRYVHSTQQHFGASESRGTPRCVSSCEELKTSETTHGANPGKILNDPMFQESPELFHVFDVGFIKGASAVREVGAGFISQSA